MLLEPDRVMSVERLVDAVSPTAPPSATREQIQICVSAIRRTLGRRWQLRRHRDAPTGSLDPLRRTGVGPDGVSARRGLARYRLDDAVNALRDALRLWPRTAPLAGGRRQLVQHIDTQLVERRLTTAGMHVDARLRLGPHNELIDGGEASPAVSTAHSPGPHRPLTDRHDGTSHLSSDHGIVRHDAERPPRAHHVEMASGYALQDPWFARRLTWSNGFTVSQRPPANRAGDAPHAGRKPRIARPDH
ncbi:hypothetical protein JQN83_14400 [Micromonospora sp. MMS20-R2-23]|uniref:Bacterial transcriptional activator domain-containing protein n=1 Tax=Micromonospora antibiotica TaxID=2807623 RepID=A0ABS3V8Q7_9ACTN|nr:hypothetical protein [Micromonospora antibiotica]